MRDSSWRTVQEMQSLNEAPAPGERRALSAAILVPEVRAAVTAFAAKLVTFKEPWVIIGGLVLGVYARPRTTVDADIVILNENTLSLLVPYLTPEFRKSREHAFTHRATGVEVELVTPGLVGIKPELTAKIIGTAVQESLSGHPVRIASVEGMIASKLGRALGGKTRSSLQDRADILALVEAQGAVSLEGMTS